MKLFCSTVIKIIYLNMSVYSYVFFLIVMIRAVNLMHARILFFAPLFKKMDSAKICFVLFII